MHEYELRKADYLRKHPNATPAQYQAAIRKIAKELRI